MYYTITKELLAENNRAFQFLHEAKGFDFEKEYFIAKHEGRFTYNQIKKVIEGNMAGDYTAAVILKPTERHYWTDRQYYIHIDQQAGKFEPLKIDNITYYGYKIDYFFAKYDFEEVRKNKTEHIYIIAQKNEFLKTDRKPSAFDYSQRFRYIPNKWGETCSDGHGKTWINKLSLMLLDGSAKQIEYKTGAPAWGDHPETVGDVIDKSGYLILERRRELKRRAIALRAERAKAAAVAADFTEKEKAIKSGIDNAKLHIAEMVLSVETEEDARALDKTVDKFRWLVWDYSHYTEKAAKKAFPSIAAVEKNLSALQTKINEILGDQKNA